MNCAVLISFRNFQPAASRCAHMMARGLAVNGCNVDFFVSCRGDYLGNDHVGCTDYRFHCYPSTRDKRGAAFTHFQMLRRGIIDKRWELIVFYGVGVQFMLLNSLARRHGVKIIYVQGDHYVPLTGMTLRTRGKYAIINMIDRYLSRHSDLNALAGTTLLADHFRKQAPKVPIYLSYPPIDIDLFANGDDIGFRHRYSLQDKKIIAYCGAVNSLEGVEILIRAMHLVGKSNPQAHLVIAGKLGITDDALTRQIDYPVLAADLGISTQVTFTGLINQNDVRGLLRSADLLVIPKLEHRRNAVAAPIKLSEYFAAGRPVIASTVGDIPTRFQDGVELRFCTPGDSNELAEIILQMLETPEVSQVMAVNGQTYARNHFDYRSWGRDLLFLLEKKGDVFNGQEKDM